MNTQIGSREVASLAIKIAISPSLEDEKKIIGEHAKQGFLSCGISFGGEFIFSVNKIIERAVVAAKRERIIGEHHAEEGSVAGAAREAIGQIMDKAIGLNVGGKIGIARYNEHISVCIYFGIGLLHLNEVAIGLGHRVLSSFGNTKEC